MSASHLLWIWRRLSRFGHLLLFVYLMSALDVGGVPLGFGRFGVVFGVWSICANEGEFFLMVSRTILLAVSANNFSSECFWGWFLPPMSWLKVIHMFFILRIRSTLSIAQAEKRSICWKKLLFCSPTVKFIISVCGAHNINTPRKSGVKIPCTIQGAIFAT